MLSHRIRRQHRTQSLIMVGTSRLAVSCYQQRSGNVECKALKL